MLTIVPLAALAVLFLVARRGGRDVCTSFLVATIASGAITVVSTEALSLFGALSFGPLVACWAAVVAVGLGSLVRGPAFPADSVSPADPTPSSRWTRGDWIVLGFLLAVLAIEAVTALVAPTNNWDSLTYHMSRVAHWIQDETIAFFPTYKPAQNYAPPFAEWVIAQVSILAQTDRFANLVQWYALIVSTVATSVIARDLGGDRRIQALAAVACGTIPSALVQTSSTQNDLVVAGWLACAVCFGIKTLQTLSYRSALLAGVSLGLALLTKGTAYVHALAFLVVGGSALVYRYRTRAVGVIALVAAVSFLLNVGHYTRNVILSGNPLALGISGQHRFTNDRLTPAILGANIVRNVGLHLATPSVACNQVTEKAIYRILGSEIDNPDSTWPGTAFRIMFSCHEDHSGNLLHLLLLILASAILLVSRSSTAEQRWYVVTVLGSFVLFCAILRWQPFHGRLQVPIFVMAAPVVALGAGRVLTSAWARRVLAVGLVVAALPWVVSNPGRPILGTRNVFRVLVDPLDAALSKNSIFTMPRLDLMCIHHPEWAAVYGEACRVVAESGARNVGVVFGAGEDWWEYPLWVLLEKECGRGRFRLEHVGVDNESSRFQKPGFVPDAVIVIGEVPETSDFGPRGDDRERGFERVLERAPLVVYLAKPR